MTAIRPEKWSRKRSRDRGTGTMAKMVPVPMLAPLFAQLKGHKWTVPEMVPEWSRDRGTVRPGLVIDPDGPGWLHETSKRSRRQAAETIT